MRSLLLTAIALLFSNGAFAFTVTSSTNPNMKGWETAELTLMLNVSNCPSSIDVEGIIKEAAEVWNNVPTSKLKVSIGGNTSSTTTDPQPTVYCETNFQAVTGADQNYVPGGARPNSSTGQLTSGLLTLNVSPGNGNISNFSRTKLTIILAHEIGHLVGLGHSESTNALMYYDGTLKAELHLSQDDVDGVTYLYPSDEFMDGKIAGCGRVGTIPPPPSSGHLIVTLLALLTPILVAQGMRPRRAVRVNKS